MFNKICTLTQHFDYPKKNKVNCYLPKGATTDAGANPYATKFPISPNTISKIPIHQVPERK